MPKNTIKSTPNATAATTALEKRITALEAEAKKNKSRFDLIISTVNQVIKIKDDPKEAMKAVQTFLRDLQRTLD